MSILPEHRRAVGSLSQSNILVAEPFFGPLLVVDIGRSSVPAHDLAAFVFERVVLNELLEILAVSHLVPDGVRVDGIIAARRIADGAV
jgi:hypothetical protein